MRDGRIRQLGEDHDQTLYDPAGPGRRRTSRLEDRPRPLPLAEKVWDARVRKHGDDHPRAIEAMGTLAYVYQGGYKMKQALALLRAGAR